MLTKTDSEIKKLIDLEFNRQNKGLEMIPSENYVSSDVLEAVGSILTNKYAEGYPGKRYYGGNEVIDQIEDLTRERIKKLFGVPFVNVQPYSGSPANLAVCLSVCQPGDVIMGQSLTAGGHLTHGWKVSATGIFYNSVQYGVNEAEKELFDYEEILSLAKKHKPKLIWVGGTAHPLIYNYKQFAEIADSVGAYLVADISHIAGLIVGGVHPSPSDFAHIITTTTHKTLRGPRGALIMVTQKGIEKDKDLPHKIDRAVFPGLQGGPHENVIAAIGVSIKEASTKEFQKYAKQIVANAKTLAGALKKNGFRLVGNGTQNHLMVIDLSNWGFGLGVFAQHVLGVCNITVNKNTVPNELSSPFYPSGLRLGTPAVTTRGMGEKEMEKIAQYITEALSEIKGYKLPTDKEQKAVYIKEKKYLLDNSPKLKHIALEVEKLCLSFPLS